MADNLLEGDIEIQVDPPTNKRSVSKWFRNSDLAIAQICKCCAVSYSKRYICFLVMFNSTEQCHYSYRMYISVIGFKSVVMASDPGQSLLVYLDFKFQNQLLP